MSAKMFMGVNNLSLIEINYRMDFNCKCLLLYEKIQKILCAEKRRQVCKMSLNNESLTTFQGKKHVIM